MPYHLDSYEQDGVSPMSRLRLHRLFGLILLCTLCVGIITAAQAQSPAIPNLSDYGAESNPTGSPIGGGAGYQQIFTSGDYTVSTAEELLDALAKARSGDIIYIEPTTEIDLTGHVELPIKAGVTLAGNRGFAGSPGPLIYCNEYDTYGLFTLLGERARITGIRLQGPDPDILDRPYGRPNSKAISVEAGNVEVDNNEIYNWSYAGISVEKHAKNVHIHHNYIHHVRRASLGYPIVVNRGFALIEANKFDYYRHAIAATGYIGSAYEARYNLVLPNATSHAFDMHGGADFCPKRTNSSCSFVEQIMGGEYVIIHHNTFMATHTKAIILRGIPRQTTQIHHNWFYTTKPNDGAYFQNYHGGNVEIYANAYGPNKQHIVDVQMTPSRFIREGRKGTDPIVATTAGFSPVVLRITSPEADQSVYGEVAVEVESTLEDILEIAKVEGRLNDQVIYSDAKLPESGELAINTRLLPDGQHTFAFDITDQTGQVITHSVRFGVANWWYLFDEMLAPVEIIFFGTQDRSATLAESAGWEYGTDKFGDFFGDDNRRVPVTHDAWLIWDTPNLREVTFTVYSRDADEAGIKLAISPDQADWTDLAVEQTRSEAPSAGGWYQYQVTGKVSQDTPVRYLRLQVAEGFAKQIQIGKMESGGLK